MNLILMGSSAAGLMSTGSGTATVNVFVGTASIPYISYRGGGTLSLPNQTVPTTGSISPTRFTKDYEVRGFAIGYSTVPKTQPIYVGYLYLEGPEPTKPLTIEVQGRAGSVTLPPSQASKNNQLGWWDYRFAADINLYNNWAPGVTRTVTLRWEE